MHVTSSSARRRFAPRILAALLAFLSLCVGVRWNSWTAGGADSYAYVTQADLLRNGSLTIPVPIAGVAPWPNALATFTPLGYSAVPGDTAIAPATGAGLPLMMAILKTIGGHAAGFLAVPLCAALLVWTTFLIGRRVVSEMVGVGAAWLVATSPVFLAMSQAQMSDVPAAAFWAQATLWAVGRSPLLSGLAASMAILIRPNLVPLAGVLGGWMLWRELNAPLGLTDRSSDGAARRVVTLRHPVVGQILRFAGGVLPGCLMVAWINSTLFGSPLSSGYGTLAGLFSVEHVSANLAKYGRWTIETQTPMALLGALAVGIAPRRIWPSADAQSAARLLGLMMLTVWAIYAAYLEFDAWWFIRFLLPSWPAITIGSAAVVVRLLDRPRWWARSMAVATLVIVGAYGIVTAIDRNVFPSHEGERRYATIAQLVGRFTDPSAAILTGAEFAGPIRYYAGRLTIRADLLDAAWLDRATQWLQEQGKHPYFLVEDWELPQFEQHFGAQSPLGRLSLAPVLAYRAYGISGTIYLFDPLRPDGPTEQPAPIARPQPRCPTPSATPLLRTVS